MAKCSKCGKEIPGTQNAESSNWTLFCKECNPPISELIDKGMGKIKLKSKNMSDKLVKKVTTGETFIATDWGNPDLWKVRLDMWRLDHNQHCPMPADHKIFQHPQDYGCVFIRFNPHTLKTEEY